MQNVGTEKMSETRLPNVSFLNSNANFYPFSNSRCVPIQIMVPDYVDESSIQWIFGIFYSMIWIIGVIGNLLILFMIVEKRVDFTVRTVFIVSLACSDLLTGLTSLPITAVGIFTRVWVFADFLCYIIGFLQATGIFVSSFTLITIAVDRYYLICYPHTVKVTYGKARTAVIAFWSIAAALALPMSIFQKIIPLEEPDQISICGRVCIEQWPKSWSWGRKAYGIAVTILQLALPLVLCSFLYTKISYRIFKQYSNRLSAKNSASSEFAERSMLRRKRTNRMMAVMVLSFVLSWFPFNLVNLIRDFELFELLLHWDYYTLIFACAHLIAMTSMICNPIIYSWFNYRFRKAVKNFIYAQPNSERTATTLL